MMKNVKKSALAIAAVSTLCASMAAQALDLKIGIAGEPYPPFTEKSPDGKWSGFEIDLVNAICKQIDAKCAIVETAWDGIIPALTTKKIDVIFNSMSITPEREKVITFSTPYYYTPVAMLGAKNLKITGIKPEDVKGKSIGVQTSTPNADYVKKYYEKTSKIRVYNTQDDVNSDLTSGRIDLQVADETGIYDFLKSPEGSKMEKKGTLPKDPMFGPGIGAGFRTQDVELKKQFDVAIKAINSSGEFKKIQAKYFDFDLSAR